MHCQVPCGIFDDAAKVRALGEDVKTIRKAMRMVRDPPGAAASAYPGAQDINQLVRWTDTKEEHADKIMRAVGDYFLAQRLSKMTGRSDYRDLLQLHHEVMIAAMKTKQTVDEKAADDLEHLVAHLQQVYTPRAADQAATLRRQDDETSRFIIGALDGNPCFAVMAASDGASIIRRDMEDGEKLAQGIAKSVQRGTLPALEAPPAYQVVDVLGKSADDVAGEILSRLPSDGSGFVVALVGLSGTGKGTTVAKLRKMLPGAITWSNGNIFRSLTLLAATHCEQRGIPLTPAVLTQANLEAWMSMLSFGQQPDGTFDTRIRGLGLDLRVSEVQNTLLKQPKVGRNIPTVAKETQGEVVAFASSALRTLSENGKVVLLEGRSQTVDYIDTPHRFELYLSDASLIGKRRAAQRVAAEAMPMIGAGDVPNTVVLSALEAAAATLA